MNLVLSILKWILVCTKKHVSAESTYLKRKVVNARKKEELWNQEKRRVVNTRKNEFFNWMLLLSHQ